MMDDNLPNAVSVDRRISDLKAKIESPYSSALRQKSYCWLVTGAAGFIGSHLVEKLLDFGQLVIGLDNFATGKKGNIEFLFDHQKKLQNNSKFKFIEADISNFEELSSCSAEIKAGEFKDSQVDFILHQAALGSVPRSIENPQDSHQSNVTGFVNILELAKVLGVKSFVYASSSSVYGDSQDLPKVESKIGNCLSPYAVTKLCDELYAAVYTKSYGLSTVGLRYFNVFGARQDPEGPYSAVIPRWVDSLTQGLPCQINGDGETSRDFCYIENVVQANILAALYAQEHSVSEVFNIAYGEKTTLNELYEIILSEVQSHNPLAKELKPKYAPFRVGDVMHSLADINKAKNLLGYTPKYNLKDGLKETVNWFLPKI